MLWHFNPAPIVTSLGKMITIFPFYGMLLSSCTVNVKTASVNV